MKRIEIIYSQALREDLLAALNEFPEGHAYSLIQNVLGNGYTNPKMGDSIWPEVNEIIIIYTESIEFVEKLKLAISKIRESYPDEGCAMFILESV